MLIRHHALFFRHFFLISNVTTMEGKKRGEKGTDLDLVPSPWIEELGLVKMWRIQMHGCNHWKHFPSAWNVVPFSIINTIKNIYMYYKNSVCLDGYFLINFLSFVMIKVKYKKEIDRKTVEPIKKKNKKQKNLDEKHPEEHSLYFQFPI